MLERNGDSRIKEASQEEVYGEMDGCPKIKGPVEGLTGRGCGDRASRLVCKVRTRYVQGRAVSVERRMLGGYTTSQGSGLTRPLPRVDTPVTKSLLSSQGWPCGSGGVTRKPRLSKDKPPQQRLSSPETTRWQEGGPCQLAAHLGCRKHTARSGARPPSWLQQIMGPRGQPYPPPVKPSIAPVGLHHT